MSIRSEFYATLFALHERMSAGDPTLLGDVAQLVIEPLIGQLRRRFRHVDDQHLQDGAADALIEYGKNPAQANATAGAGVMGFLVKRSESRVKDRTRKEKQRDRAEGGYAHGLDPSAERDRGNVVELRRVRTEHDQEALNNAVSALPIDVEERLEREAQIKEVLAGTKTELDRRLLEMILAGVRETAEYARVLGIDGKPVEVQEAEVKRYKDRLTTAAKRRGEAKRSGPKRRGRPPHRHGDDGGKHG